MDFNSQAPGVTAANIPKTEIKPASVSAMHPIYMHNNEMSGKTHLFGALCRSKSGLMNKHIVKHIVKHQCQTLGDKLGFGTFWVLQD